MPSRKEILEKYQNYKKRKYISPRSRNIKEVPI